MIFITRLPRGNMGACVAVMALLSSGSLSAQARGPVFERFDSRARFESDSRSTLAAFDSRDYRYEGAIIGGVVFGGALAILGHGLCESSDSSRDCTASAVLAFFGGGAIGALTGLLIGGAIDKNPAPAVSGQ